MKSKIAFTKKDLVVALVCLVFLLMSLGAIGSRGRERAKRAVCLSNLKQLSLAWHQYADDNDGKIVNGGPWKKLQWGDARAPTIGDVDYNYHKNEIPWIGTISKYNNEATQLLGIKNGALWPYTKNERLYRCPTGLRGQMLTYSIMDGMNGLLAARSGASAALRTPGVYIKKISEIYSPPPASRIIFIDEGYVGEDSFAVHYATEGWFDNAPSIHGGGVTLSFADGHSDYRRWNGQWTLAWAKVMEYAPTFQGVTKPGDKIDLTPEDGMPGPSYKYVAATKDDFEDLYYIQKGCWGGLDYNPSH